jgi:arylsulfatase A-like enzyme
VSRILLVVAALAVGGGLRAAPPNVVFVLTDDQGYGDMSCHGNPNLKTPNIDRLHDEGVRFTDFHVSPTCAPTRAALMTGRHEFKSGVTHTILERERLALSAVTLPQVLKAAGYTTGIFGKWHLGDEAAYRPDKRGFDECFSHGGGGIGQSYPGSCGDAPGNTYFGPTILHNGRFEETEGYCTDVFFDHAFAWMEKVKGRQPFYCHIATNAPHRPLQVPSEDAARYKGVGKTPDVAKFFGMVANIDDNVGRLLAKLKAWGIERDTLVVFMNDNGGTVGCDLFNAGMRGRKVTPWLGGTRAASFWRWPGTLSPGDRPQLAAHIDFLPTLAALAGATLPQPVDGRSLAQLLKDANAPWSQRTLFTHVGRWPKGEDPHKFRTHDCSVRTPQWHLVSAGKPPQKWQLFDVTLDYGETTDLAAKLPEVVATLAAEQGAWWKTVRPLMVNEDAVGPKSNPFAALYRKQFPDGR